MDTRWQAGDFLHSRCQRGHLCDRTRVAIWDESDQGTCAITGTPTATAVNATYTVWANISGTSYSGQVWLEVGLNAPNPSYAPASYTTEGHHRLHRSAEQHRW